MRFLRRAGSALLAFGTVLLGFALLPSASGAAPVYNATLFAPHVGSTNPGFQTGSCPQEGWGWHFVLQGNSSDFVAVKATFQDAGDVTTFIASPTTKHAYVFTPGPDTLLAAVAEVTGPDLTFNLSHVCTGPSTTTTTSTSTTSTTAPTTTTTSTTEPTTTTSTTEPTTTTSTTSTTEPSTTTSTSTTTTQPTDVLVSTTVPGSTSTLPVSSSSTQPTDVGDVTTVPQAAPSGTSPPPSSGTLPRTGSDDQALVATGLALLVFGTVLLTRSRMLGRG